MGNTENKSIFERVLDILQKTYETHKLFFKFVFNWREWGCKLLKNK